MKGKKGGNLLCNFPPNAHSEICH